MNIVDAANRAYDNNGIISENNPNVYESGYNKGKDDGVALGYDSGYSQADLKLWEMFTANDKRESFNWAFYGTDFSGYTFIKPVVPKTYIQQIFYNYAGTEYPKNIDLSQIDTSRAYNSDYNRGFFQYGSKITTVPDMGIPALNGLNLTYANMARLVTVEKVRVHENTVFTDTFKNCPNLENVTFGGDGDDFGYIGQDISFSSCPKLSPDSLMNIIEHLKDTGIAHTLTLHPDRLTWLETEEPSAIAIANSKNWTITA